MDTILTVNAGSSSVKFVVFAVDVSSGGLDRRIKGQVDGIGTKPRLRAAGPDGAPLVDQAFPSGEVADVAAALHSAAAWLRHQHAIEPIAVGHRVVHGGPQYEPPVLIDDRVLADLERCVPLAPLPGPLRRSCLFAPTNRVARPDRSGRTASPLEARRAP